MNFVYSENFKLQCSNCQQVQMFQTGHVEHKRIFMENRWIQGKAWRNLSSIVVLVFVLIFISNEIINKIYK